MTALPRLWACPRGVSLLLVIALMACGRDEREDDTVSRGTNSATESRAPRDTAPTSEAPSGRSLVACEGLETSILAAPATRAGLGREFGAPDSTRSTTEPNRHVPGAIDSLFEVHYPGLTARLRKPPDGRDLAEHVRITATRYLRPPDLSIGAASSAIIEILGEPTAREPTGLVYACGTGAEQPVTFRLRDGAVESVEIDYYVD